MCPRQTGTLTVLCWYGNSQQFKNTVQGCTYLKKFLHKYKFAPIKEVRNHIRLEQEWRHILAEFRQTSSLWTPAAPVCYWVCSSSCLKCSHWLPPFLLNVLQQHSNPYNVFHYGISCLGHAPSISFILLRALLSHKNIAYRHIRIWTLNLMEIFVFIPTRNTVESQQVEPW